MPLFDPYPASPEQILASAGEIEGRATAVGSVVDETVRRVVAASSHVDGSLLTAIPLVAGPVMALGGQVDERSRYAATVVRAWAVSVTIYDAGVEALNAEYDAAAADTRAATTADLHRRHAVLEGSLDDAARQLARLLDAGPSDDGWRRLGGLGPVPSSYAPPVTRPRRGGDPAAITALTVLLGDPRACLPETGNVADCLVEAASVLPVGKLLKLRKLLRAFEKADDVKDTSNYVDDVADVLDELPHGIQKKVRVVRDDAELHALYARIARGATPADVAGYDGIMMRRPDGVLVGIRGGSKSGGPTIDVRYPSGAKGKVHVE